MATLASMVLNQGNNDSSCPIRYVGQEAILALLLDYDGTLSPIAPHPDLATIPPETKKVSKEQQRWENIQCKILQRRRPKLYL